MSNRIVAEFKNKEDAERAIHALKDIGIEPGADLPENAGNPVIIAAVPGTNSGTISGVVASPMIVGTGEALEVSESDETGPLERITVSVSVRDDAEADKAMAVLRQHNAVFGDSAQSTIDEVANPAQVSDRIR